MALFTGQRRLVAVTLAGIVPGHLPRDVRSDNLDGHLDLSPAFAVNYVID
jgi:hypothetical protein